MGISVGKDGSIIEKLKEMLEEYMKKTKPEYYSPVENLLDLIYEHYTENNPVEKHSCREISKGQGKGTGRVAARVGWYE